MNTWVEKKIREAMQTKSKRRQGLRAMAEENLRENYSSYAQAVQAYQEAKSEVLKFQLRKRLDSELDRKNEKILHEKFIHARVQLKKEENFLISSKILPFSLLDTPEEEQEVLAWPGVQSFWNKKIYEKEQRRFYLKQYYAFMHPQQMLLPEYLGKASNDSTISVETRDDSTLENAQDATYQSIFEDWKHWDLSFLSDEKTIETRGVLQSSKEIMIHYFEFLKNYSLLLSRKGKHLLFFGGTGTGKTHLASLLSEDLRRQGYFVLAYTSSNLFNIIEEYQQQKSSFHPDEERLNRLSQQVQDFLTCDFLFIDDLAVSSLSDSKIEEYFLMIYDYKSAHKKNLIITTNLTMVSLKKYLDERIFSRLMGTSFTIPFKDLEDFRIQARMK